MFRHSIAWQKSGFIANSNHKIQALFKDIQGPKFSVFKHQNDRKKPYRTLGASQFELQCDTEMYYLVLTNTVIIRTDDRLPSSTGLQSVVSVAFISNVNNWQQLFTLYITTTTATANYS